MSKGSYLSLLGMAAMFEGMASIPEERKLSDEEIQYRLNRLEAKKQRNLEDLNLKRGLKKFHYGSNVVWAINENVADKKAIKKGYLNNA